MTKTVATMDLKGKAYAKVATRVKEFREDCPNGLIHTEPKLEGDRVVFYARILKDKTNENSAEAVGHAFGTVKGQKAFEKLETIAVGRALALLGYMASGEIASSDEMEGFYEYKNEKKAEAIATLEACQNIEQLKEAYFNLGSLKAEPEVVEKKNEMKAKLNPKKQ